MNELPVVNHRISASAPAGGDLDGLERQKRAWQSQPFLAQVLDAVPEMILVLNSIRQIVFANSAFLGHLKIHDTAELGGLRWGDVLGCKFAVEEGGCGAARGCRLCGGLKAMETAVAGTRHVQECRIMTLSGEALDLQVTAVPVDLGADRCLICTISDISAPKRRRVLEHLFFHDVLNTAVGVKSLADLLGETEGGQAPEVVGMIATAAATLVEQIQSQRLLMMAENKNLTVCTQPIDSLAFLQGVLTKWGDQANTRRLKLSISADSASIRFSSDEAILSHVMNSMVKNAFDASSRGMEITLGCHREDQVVVFRVRNNTVMTEDVQLQVFQRSFSTRGSGRGLGTYSMKLLTEQCLGGKVGFNSGGSDGTVFYIRLPLTPLLP